MSDGRIDWQRGLREAWVTPLPAEKVLAAVRRKLEWHTQRREFWKQQREELKSKAAEAIRLDDPEEMEKLVSDMLSNSYSSRPDFGVRLDPEFQNKLQHADKWMKQHQTKIREYAGWERFLGLMSPSALLDLEHGDLIYFAIGTKEQETEE